MTMVDFIMQLFCRIDDHIPKTEKHSQDHLYPNEVVTLAIFFALKGVGNRAFYHWLKRDYKGLFPRLPVQTRLSRLFTSHRHWTQKFMAEPSLIDIADSYGIEWIYPRHEGRREQPMGKEGLTANIYDDTAFQDMVNRTAAIMALFTDEGFEKKDWHPTYLKICFQKVMHRRMPYFKSRLAFTLAMFNLLVTWDGIQVDEAGCVHFSLAPLSLYN